MSAGVVWMVSSMYAAALWADLLASSMPRILPFCSMPCLWMARHAPTPKRSSISFLEEKRENRPC